MPLQNWLDHSPHPYTSVYHVFVMCESVLNYLEITETGRNLRSKILRAILSFRVSLIHWTMAQAETRLMVPSGQCIWLVPNLTAMNKFLFTSEFHLNCWLVIKLITSLKRHSLFLHKARRLQAEAINIHSVISFHIVSVVCLSQLLICFFLCPLLYLCTLFCLWRKVCI